MKVITYVVYLHLRRYQVFKIWTFYVTVNEAKIKTKNEIFSVLLFQALFISGAEPRAILSSLSHYHWKNYKIEYLEVKFREITTSASGIQIIIFSPVDGVFFVSLLECREGWLACFALASSLNQKMCIFIIDVLRGNHRLLTSYTIAKYVTKTEFFIWTTLLCKRTQLNSK